MKLPIKMSGAATTIFPAPLFLALLQIPLYADRLPDTSQTSVVLFGVTSEITDPDSKRETRQPTDGEIRATAVFSLPISEGSVKIRKGPPVDLEEDMGVPAWAECIPLRTVLGPPEADVFLLPGLPTPALLDHPRFGGKSFRQ